ncbi:MAG: tRNA pseudouridine(38-40) synthase TruA [Clostridia bacterium]|nr:tRNA pseudouridine(38-40) synthase TruA [Clostridia bacterium]
MKYFAKIKYLGTAFHGFQVQPGLRTVQGELNEALNQAFGLPCKVTGCSRTDAGVHANEFCLTVECDGGTIPDDKLPIAVSRFLPEDLSLFYAKSCADDFHPRYDVVEKEYLYRIINTRIYDPFEYGRAWFVGRPITDEGLSRMNKAAKHFIGKYDFSTFMSEGSDVEDTVRSVTSLSVTKNDDLIEIRISADGFLYNMVRIIVGTLVEVAFGRFSPDDIPDIIASKDRSRAGMTAPAEGLYLNSVKY